MKRFTEKNRQAHSEDPLEEKPQEFTSYLLDFFSPVADKEGMQRGASASACGPRRSKQASGKAGGDTATLVIRTGEW
jgi:hypothetical protein